VKQQMQMDKNTPYDAPLQGSNRNYDTGKQPIYVK